MLFAITVPGWLTAIWNILVVLLGVFLVLLVLIQRGKGGGLAGAFGGVGGSSPFGSRAGDTFTRITIAVAAAWMLAIIVQVWMVQGDRGGKPDEIEGTVGTK